jgi:signal peptidase I
MQTEAMRNSVLDLVGTLVVVAVAIAGIEADGHSNGGSTSILGGPNPGAPNPVTEQRYIPSGAMEPTIPPGSQVTVQTDAYAASTPHTGDIIIFRIQPEWCFSSAQEVIKRVIAVPGQTVSSSGNEILINGAPLDETWSHSAQLINAIRRHTVARNSYFVMGDNAAASCDSRAYGDVPSSDIIGKVVGINGP